MFLLYEQVKLQDINEEDSNYNLDKEILGADLSIVKRVL
jgi:hypothetical protein